MLALRHGVHSFWETLPVGQYDYPDWLFFGGRRPAQSVQALASFLPTLLDEAQEVAHLDFHTGLVVGPIAQLLVSESEGLDNCAWWLKHFDGRIRETDEELHARRTKFAAVSVLGCGRCFLIASTDMRRRSLGHIRRCA